MCSHVQYHNTSVVSWTVTEDTIARRFVISDSLNKLHAAVWDCPKAALGCLVVLGFPAESSDRVRVRAMIGDRVLLRISRSRESREQAITRSSDQVITRSSDHTTRGSRDEGTE